MSTTVRLGVSLSTADLGTVSNAASFAEGQTAPAGYHWEFVTDDITGARVTDVNNQPVVALVGN